MTPEQIRLVHSFIEQCLQRYMSLTEIKNTLLVKARINPAITELVWKSLENDNPEFFRAYHLRLLVIDQIKQYNQLLERQAELVNRLSAVPTTVHLSDGPDISDNGMSDTISEVMSIDQPLIKEEDNGRSDTISEGLNNDLSMIKEEDNGRSNTISEGLNNFQPLIKEEVEESM